jgi:hypothetical protein
MQVSMTGNRLHDERQFDHQRAQQLARALPVVMERFAAATSGSTTTTTVYAYSIGWSGIFCIDLSGRYHLYDMKKEVFLVSDVSSRYQK